MRQTWAQHSHCLMLPILSFEIVDDCAVAAAERLSFSGAETETSVGGRARVTGCFV